MAVVENFIDFKSLPQLVQRSIHEKFTYDQFSSFEECSHIAYAICKSRPNFLFPLYVESIALWDWDEIMICAMIAEGRHLKITAADVAPKAILHVDHLEIEIHDGLPKEACDLVVKYVKGLKTVRSTKQYYFTEYYSLLSKAMHLKELSMYVDKTDLREVPNEYFDFSNIETVNLMVADNLWAENSFATKAGKIFKTDFIHISLEEMTHHVNRWKRGEWSFNHKIVIQGVHGHSIEELAEEMKEYSTEFEDICNIEYKARLKYKWVVKRRNDPNQLSICFWGKADPVAHSVRILTFEQEAVNYNM